MVQSNAAKSLSGLDLAISGCRACERLVEWRERVAIERRAAYADQEYWGRPIPGFGVERPKLLIVGLAPGAHGANRTGRVFTGDRSGDWLYAALHRAGLANQPISTDVSDGLKLFDTRVVVSVRCAPPDNKPTPAEFATCAPWLLREIELAAPDLRAVLALGAAAWNSALSALGSLGWQVPRPKPRFGHGAQVVLSPGPGAGFERPIAVVGSYHPSQQNTFTGRLTAEMLDDAVQAARAATADERRGDRAYS
ncbi:MAG: uracil-DNA glycosylase [Actinomycetes bacterium]